MADFNLTIPQGKITAFVGASGSGKTTVAHLIAGFYTPQQGSISIGGVDISTLGSEELMQLISFVFQDNYMFNESIADNIAMGMSSDQDKIRQAAQIARCDDFISALEQQYDTIYGDNGTYLSQGEQQRIQLARVVLKNAPIFIFDEVSSSCDIENEYKMQQACKKVMQGKTGIIIAHRLNTIKMVDQIVVFDKGKIADTGKTR